MRQSAGGGRPKNPRETPRGIVARRGAYGSGRGPTGPREGFRAQAPAARFNIRPAHASIGQRRPIHPIGGPQGERPIGGRRLGDTTTGQIGNHGERRGIGQDAELRHEGVHPREVDRHRGNPNEHGESHRHEYERGATPAPTGPWTRGCTTIRLRRWHGVAASPWI